MGMWGFLVFFIYMEIIVWNSVIWKYKDLGGYYVNEDVFFLVD